MCYTTQNSPVAHIIMAWACGLCFYYEIKSRVTKTYTIANEKFDPNTINMLARLTQMYCLPLPARP